MNGAEIDCLPGRPVAGQGKKRRGEVLQCDLLVGVAFDVSARIKDKVDRRLKVGELVVRGMLMKLVATIRVRD